MRPRPATEHAIATTSPAVTVAVAGAAALGALGVAVAIPPSSLLGLVGPALLLGVCTWFAVSGSYGITLGVLLLYLGLLDGFIRLRTGNADLTLVRDLLLYSIVAGAVVRLLVRSEPLRFPPLTGWVIAFVAVVLVQLLNPENGTWAHSLAGVRPHLAWVPLFFLGYLVVRTPARLRTFFVLLLVVAAVNAIVATVQFGLTPEQFSDWGPGYRERIEGTGDVSGRNFVDDSGEARTRPFGLGSDFGFAGILGLLAAPAALALVTIGRRRVSPWASLPLAAGVVLAVATSQARVAVVGAVIAAGVFAALAAASRRAVPVFAGLVVAGALVFAVVSALGSAADEGSFDRYSSIAPSELAQTTYDYRRETIARIPQYAVDFPLGAGLGSAGPAASVPGAGENTDLDAESQPTFLIIELGLPGLLVLLGLNVHLLLLAVRRIRHGADPELRLLLSALAAPVIALFATWIVGASTASNPGAPYFWFAAGALAFWLRTDAARPPAVRSSAAGLAPPAT